MDRPVQPTASAEATVPEIHLGRVGVDHYAQIWLQVVDGLYARHPLKRRLCQLLRNRINPATGLGAYSGPKDLSAHERIETSAKSVENAIRGVVRDGMIIKSHGRHYAGPGLGVGVFYALTVPPTYSHLLNDIQINRPYPTWEAGINRPYPSVWGYFLFRQITLLTSNLFPTSHHPPQLLTTCLNLMARHNDELRRIYLAAFDRLRRDGAASSPQIIASLLDHGCHLIGRRQREPVMRMGDRFRKDYEPLPGSRTVTGTRSLRSWSSVPSSMR